MNNRLIILFLTLLGFGTACDREREVRVEYGTPHIHFQTQGKVIDQAGNPIPGIRVESNGAQVSTASNGNYDISGDSWPGGTALRFTDIDGADHGGEFAEKELTVEFSEADRIADGDNFWNKGAYAKTDVDISLEERK